MLALLYDVHGNLHAVEAVLADARDAGADRFLLGGDYALFGPFPADAVAALQALDRAQWIRGNVDRWTAHPDQAPEDDLIQEAIVACRSAVDAQTIAELDALPERLAKHGTLYCHASPVSDMLSFLPEPADDEDELLGGVSERRVVFGHTHLQFRRTRADGIELINPGSVGMPLDGDSRAAYALVDEGDNTVEFRRVEYDRAAGIAALRRRFPEAPWAQRTIQRLQTGAP